MKVDIVNIGTIPPRTSVSFLDEILVLGQDAKVDGSTLRKRYVCMDCGYDTQDVDKMLEHQDNQKKHHSWWQQLRRWWSI